MPYNAILLANAEISSLKSDGLTAIEGTAYSGGPVSQWWYDGPIYIDLAGMSVRQQVPLLYSHTNTPAARLGIVNAEIKDGRVAITGGIDPNAENAKSLIAQGKAIPWQLSVGVQNFGFDEVKAGKTATVNGRDIEGPALIVTKSELHEVSLVAVGADAETQLNILASLNLNPHHPQTGVQPMPEPINTPKIDTEKLQASATQAERDRIKAIHQTAHRFPEIQAKAVEEGWTLDKTREAVLAAMEASFEKTAPTVTSGNASAVNTSMLKAAVSQALRLPEKEIIASDGQKALEAADARWHGRISLQELILEAAAANGNAMECHSLNDSNWFDACQRAIKASTGYSSINLPGILGDTINRELLKGFSHVDTSWEKIAKISSVKDFRAVTSYRLASGGAFSKVAPTGELKHGTLSETSFTNKADTYGEMLGLTRQDIINDDLGALAAIPEELGLDAAMVFNQVFWKEFMDNSAFFKNDNHNLLTSSALSIDNLGAAVAKFRGLKDESGRLSGLTPEILLVPPTLEVLANQIFADQAIIAIGVGSSAKVAPSSNPFRGKYTPVCSPYLEDTTLTGYSTSTYYLLANPAFRAAVQVCFLNGVRRPTVQTSEMDFNTLGIQFRAYYDFGVTKMDPRAGVKVTA